VSLRRHWLGTTERGAVRCRSYETADAGNRDLYAAQSAGRGRGYEVAGRHRFFPQDQPSQTVIGDAIASMCPSVESLR